MLNWFAVAILAILFAAPLYAPLFRGSRRGGAGNNSRQDIVEAELAKVEADLTKCRGDSESLQRHVDRVSQERDSFRAKVDRAEQELTAIRSDLDLCMDSLHKRTLGLKATEEALENLSITHRQLTEKHQKTQDDLGESNKRYWRWKVSDCGFKSESKNLSIAILYVRAEDREIARAIRRELLHADKPTPWSVKEVEQTVAGGSRVNPSESGHVVVFSSDPSTRNIAHFLKLIIHETTAHAPAHAGQETDVEVVVFGHTKSDDYC